MIQSERQRLDEVREHVHIISFLNYREYLQHVYLYLRSREKKYSYLKMAEALGFSATNVIYLITKGRRPLSINAAKRIAEALQLDEAQKTYLTILVAYQNSRDMTQRENLFRALIQQRESAQNSHVRRRLAELFTEWYHPVIYKMTFLSDFRADPAWIAARLRNRIKPAEAQASLAFLESIRLLNFDPQRSHLQPTPGWVSTPSEIGLPSVARFHETMIDFAREFTRHEDHDLLDITAITVSIPLALLPELKREIGHFQEKILAISENAASQDAVYQMNIQMFPLVQPQEQQSSRATAITGATD